MKNPWTRKNPFMSMWLSGANSAIARARGPATAAVKREAKKAMSSATAVGIEQVTSFWADAFKPAAAATKAQALSSKTARPVRKTANAVKKAKPRKPR